MRCRHQNLQSIVWLGYLVALILSCSFGAQIVPAAETVGVSPQALYDRAWLLVQQSYYDRKFRGQDWNRWRHLYDNKLKTLEDAHAAIKSMIASVGDPDLTFELPGVFDDEKSVSESSFYSVGMILEFNNAHKLIVAKCIEGSPAFEAGLLPGVEILELDGKPVRGQSRIQVIQRIRGPVDTVLGVAFRSDHGVKRVALRRIEIPSRSVYVAEVLTGNIGYIRLGSFIPGKARDEMKQALNKLSVIDGLILDIRDSQGGSLNTVPDLADMFLAKGVIFSIIDADGYKTSVMSSQSPIFTKPMIALVNKDTANASELLAASLSQNGRSQIVGEKTCGSASIGSVRRLEDGSVLMLPIGRWLTPNDTDITGQGLKPDVVVSASAKDISDGTGPWFRNNAFTSHGSSKTKDKQLLRAIEVLKNSINSVDHAH
jgi:carboxyl-terminal processing protease